MITLNLCHLPDPRTLEAIEALARQVGVLGEQLMAVSTAVQAKLDEIGTVLDGIGPQLTTGVAGIQADIQALKDQIAAGGMTEAEILNALSGLAAKAANVGVSAQAVTDLDLANPGVPPAPPPDQV